MKIHNLKWRNFLLFWAGCFAVAGVHAGIDDSICAFHGVHSRFPPQEGLKIGLARADFALARMFALRVLDVSPDDPAANFALGMDFFVQRQYARAQTYLERCLERHPDDPAVLNNLAQCHSSYCLFSRFLI